jgi:hypothetical protein
MKRLLRIGQESEANDFDGIATGNKSEFRYLSPCSKMFAWSPAEVIPRTNQAMGYEENYDHSILHCTETDRYRCSAQGQ